MAKKGRFRVYYNGTLGAGATDEVLDTGIGHKGAFVGASIWVNGAADTAKQSKINVHVDGEADPSLVVAGYLDHGDTTGMREQFDFVSGSNQPNPKGSITQWDDVGFIYAWWFYLRSDYLSRLRVTVTNGDGTNPIEVRVLVLYEEER